MPIKQRPDGPIIEPFGGVWPDIHPSAFVHRTAVIIGRVQIGPECSIWPNTTLRGDDGDIVIGARSNVQDGTTVHITGDLSHLIVGERVTIGHNCIIHGCRIEDDCVIGMGSIVMDNAVVGSGSFLGAGSLVTQNKVIPPGSLAFGNPMKVRRPVTEEERDWIDHSWRTYLENGRRYLAELEARQQQGPERLSPSPSDTIRAIDYPGAVEESSIIPARRLQELPLFPLPAAQLFPDALLPLYVFEQRYRDLVRDVLASGDAALGVPTLQPGYEPDYEKKAPPLHDVFGAGVIVASRERDDGTWDIVVRGTTRVRLLSEHPRHARYRTAHVEALVERAAANDHPLYGRMRGLLGQLAHHAPEAAEPIGLMLGNAESPGELTDLVAAHAVSDGELRMRLMRTLEVEARMTLVCDHLARLLLQVYDRSDVPDTVH